MPVNAALTAGEQTNLNAGGGTAVSYLSAVANTIYATATVAFDPNFPVAALSVSGVSADWLTVPRDATIRVTDSTDTIVRGYYRARLDQTGVVTNPTAIFVNEIGRGDPGLLAQAIRMNPIQAGDHVTVYKNWNGWSILPRIAYSGGTAALIFEDFNKLYTNANQYPGPATAIIIKRSGDSGNGKTGAWAWRNDPGHSYATLEFTIIDTEWPSAGAVTYLATPPGSWTVTGGSVASNTFTARVPAAADNYILTWVVSEANGGQTIRQIPIWVYDFVNYFPVPLQSLTVEKDRTGTRAGLTLFDNSLSLIPEGTLCCVWEEATANGALVPSMSRFINGFILRENRTMEPGLRGAELELAGPAFLLQNLNANSQYLTAVAGTPANWQEITTLLSYIDFIIYWIMSRRTTLLYMFDYVPLGIPATQWKMNAWSIPTGTVLQQVRKLVDRFIGNFGSDASGQFVVTQHPSVKTYATRGSTVVTRDLLTAGNYEAAPTIRQLRSQYRKTRGEGFISDGVTATAVLSDAPDTVPGQGSSEDTLPSQVVISQDEHNERTGMRFALVNNPLQATVKIPMNRDVYEPAHMQFVNVDVPAYLNPYGVGYNANIVPMRVTKSYLGDGAVDVVLTAEFETAGLPGKTVAVPIPQPTLFGSYSQLPVTLSLPPSSGLYGPPSTFVPTRVLVTSHNGAIYRGLGTLAPGMTFVGYSMPGGIVTSLAGGAVDDTHFAIVDATQDPYDAARMLAIGSYGVGSLANPFSGTPAWTDLGHTPQTNYAWGFLGGDRKRWKWGKIEGSTNVQGYFGWLEIPDLAHTGQHLFYCYTTDNFATVNRTDTGIVVTIGSNAERQIGLTLGQFATAASNINVFISGYGSTIRSQNGGASFSAYTYTLSHDGSSVNGLSMPLSNPGGGNNVGYQNLFALQVAGGNGTPIWVHGKGSIQTQSPSGILDYGNSPRSTLTLTIDSNYAQFILGTGLLTTSDGGATLQQFTTPLAGVSGEALNGWPTNPNFLLLWENGSVAFTIDGGATCQSFTGLGGPHYTCAFADFSEVYPSGGVHP